MRAGHYESSDAPFTTAELEFFAEEEKITIIPKITTSQCDADGRPGYLQLLSGVCGKFEPNKPVDVPLWLALELRKRNQCEIKLPPWMHLSRLRESIHAERMDMSSFQPLPFHYVEVAKLIFTNAKEDIGSNYFKTRDIVTSIQCLRMNKIVQGIKQVQGPVTITLRNLSAFECNTVRHIFLRGMDSFHELSELISTVERRHASQPSQASIQDAPL